MSGINVRLDGHSAPITIRMQTDLVQALRATSGNRKVSESIRSIFKQYLAETPGDSTYAKLKYAAKHEQRSVCGVMRNILRLAMDKRGVISYVPE